MRKCLLNNEKGFLCRVGIYIAATFVLSFCPSAQAAYATSELNSAAVTRSVSVNIAEAEMLQAQTALKRTQSDPLALKAELMSTQARLTQARASLITAQLNVRLLLAQDLAALTSAEWELKLATARFEANNVNLNAVQIRLKAGAATNIDLEKAQVDVRNAKAAIEQAKDALGKAQGDVKLRAGRLPAQQLGATVQPVLSNLQAALAHHPRLLRAQATVDLRRHELAVKSTDLSSPVETLEARDSLNSALRLLEDTERELRTELANVWQSYQQATATLSNRQRSQAVSAENLRVQEGRFGKGLISRMMVLQARADFAQVEANVDAARAAVEIALVRLAVTANTTLWK